MAKSCIFCTDNGKTKSHPKKYCINMWFCSSVFSLPSWNWRQSVHTCFTNWPSLLALIYWLGRKSIYQASICDAGSDFDFFSFHQNMTFSIFHTWRNVKDALRRFEMSLSLLYPFYLENLLLNYVFWFENNEMRFLYFGFATNNTDLQDMRGLYLFCALSVSCFYSKETKNFLNSNVSEF